MAEASEQVLEEPPGGLGVIAKAALPMLPVINQLPGVKKASPEEFEGMAVMVNDVVVAREQVAGYARVCGFPDKDVAPLTFPHMLAQGLHVHIMTDPRFPAPAVGTVHLENSITQHRPVAIGEKLDVRTAVSAATPHPKGTVYLMDTTVTSGSSGGETVWESTSTYLRRGKGEDSAPAGAPLPDIERTGVTWKVPADQGRRYAAVSGDYNPIHLYPLTAKALGFPRQIAHGMWTKARCVAALENRLPDAVRVEVAFKKPVLLPGSVAFGAEKDQQGDYGFSLRSPKDNAPHLVGRTTAL